MIISSEFDDNENREYWSGWYKNETPFVRGDLIINGKGESALFLLDALHHVASSLDLSLSNVRYVYSQNDLPLPDQDSASAADRQRASRLLTECLPSYTPKDPPMTDTMSEYLWGIAQELALQPESAEEDKKVHRKVLTVMAKWFADQDVLVFAKPIVGGAVVNLKPGLWEVDDEILRERFRFGQIDLNDPYSHNPHGDHFLFVGEQQIRRAIASHRRPVDRGNKFFFACRKLETFDQLVFIAKKQAPEVRDYLNAQFSHEYEIVNAFPNDRRVRNLVAKARKNGYPLPNLCQPGNKNLLRKLTNKSDVGP